MAPTVNSATALALRPGVFTTSTLWSRAACMSMLTGPPRDTAMNLSFGNRASIDREIGARCVTSSPASPMKSMISSGCPMNSFRPSSFEPA